MKKPLKGLIYLLVIPLLISCGNSKVNTEANKAYYRSNKTLTGNLDPSEYLNLKNTIEKELNTIVPEGKSILIHFRQAASNCIALGYNEKDFSYMTNKEVHYSSEISSGNNAIDFFVYSENSFHKDRFQKRDNFLMDPGFFYNEIFSLHKNCSAFFILKPNGQFLKYYGEDYFDKVKAFLQKSV